MTKLILVSGQAEAGKTLTAGTIKNKLESEGKKVTLLPFASYLKFICKEHFGWDGKKDAKGRKILQYVGTDVVRKKNPDFWVKVVADFIETFGESFDFIICDDVRFPNEIDYFRNICVIDFLSIRVIRENYENSLTQDQRNHLSETSLDNYPFDIYIYSKSGLTNLQNAIDKQLFEDPAIRMWLE